ncbi:MAG: type II toxin-antitoxin system Phd/YefM family antitoxin [Acidimicrobiales bacterium]
MPSTVTVSTLKAKALSIVEEVARTGDAVVITKRGKAVARLVPIEAPPCLLGSVTYHVDEDRLLAPTGEAWEAEAELE